MKKQRGELRGERGEFARREGDYFRIGKVPIPHSRPTVLSVSSASDRSHWRGMQGHASRTGRVFGEWEEHLVPALDRSDPRSGEGPLGSGGGGHAGRPAPGLPGRAAQAEEGDLRDRRDARHPRPDAGHARRQPPAAGADPRGGRPVDRPRDLRRRRPRGRPGRLPRRDPLRRPGSGHQSCRAAGGQRQETSTRPRGSSSRSWRWSSASRPRSTRASRSPRSASPRRRRNRCGPSAC